MFIFILVIYQHQHCLKYETDTLDHSSSDGSEITVEVTYHGSETKNCTFHLNENKVAGFAGIACESVSTTTDQPDLITIESMRIRQNIGTDGWGVKLLNIQTYPLSGDYQPYALLTNETRFWIDGDNSIDKPSFDWYPACGSGHWCDLQRTKVGLKGIQTE